MCAEGKAPEGTELPEMPKGEDPAGKDGIMGTEDDVKQPGDGMEPPKGPAAEAPPPKQ